MRMARARVRALVLAAVCSVAVAVLSTSASAQQDGPAMVAPRLDVRLVAGGLSQPTNVAFLGANDMLVTEMATGRVRRVVNGAVQSMVLDLAVNSFSERGLLG